MKFRAYTDNELNRVVVLNPDDKTDREVILKHPFLLRVRCWLAAGRIKRRERKLNKFNKRHAK
jgi:hypothetical protein